jgi:hypothetical protein
MFGADGSNMDGKEVLLVQQADSPPDDWELLLEADPRADYFHTTHWTTCVQDHHPDLSAFWLTARLAGRLVGGLAGVRKSMPVVRLESNLEGTSGGPLLHSSLSADEGRRVFHELMEAYLGLRGSSLGRTCVTLNHGQEQEFGARLRESSMGWQYHETPAAVIPLAQGLEFVEMNLLKKNKRNERNRALRRDARIKITNDPELLATYYSIYEKASRRWNLPPAPLPFLQALLADPHTTESGMTRTFFTCVMLEEQVIGGHLNLQFRDRVVAWNGVTDPNFSKTHFPATLAVWGDIEESCRRGAQILDLGGSGGVVSLESFKSNFGAESESRGHYVLDSVGMKILRGGRKLLNGLRGASTDKAPKRWHDTDAHEDGSP